MNKKLLVSVFLFFIAFSLMLLSKEESKGKKIWEDERISITLDKMERADSFPERLKSPESAGLTATYNPPKKDHDFVFIHMTIVEKRDLKMDPSEIRINKPNCPHLIDDRGKTHWAGTLQFDITTLYEAKADRARAPISSYIAELKRAEATLKKDERLYKRQAKFFEQKITSEEALKAAKAKYDISTAQHQAIIYNIEQAWASLPITLKKKKGYMFVEMPKDATPVQLKYVYQYRGEPAKYQEIKFGQIDIDLSLVQ